MVSNSPPKRLAPMWNIGRQRFDMVAMSQLIDAAVASRPDGLVVSIPDADALGKSIKAAVAAKIPAALGVKEAAVVLKYIVQSKLKGIGVILITHNVHHAWAVGDTFTVLNRGRSYGTFRKADTHREKLLQMMAGREELDELGVELDLIAKRDPSEAGKLEHQIAEELDRDAPQDQ